MSLSNKISATLKMLDATLILLPSQQGGTLGAFYTRTKSCWSPLSITCKYRICSSEYFMLMTLDVLSKWS